METVKERTLWHVNRGRWGSNQQLSDYLSAELEWKSLFSTVFLSDETQPMGKRTNYTKENPSCLQCGGKYIKGMMKSADYSCVLEIYLLKNIRKLSLNLHGWVFQWVNNTKRKHVGLVKTHVWKIYSLILSVLWCSSWPNSANLPTKVHFVHLTRKIFVCGAYLRQEDDVPGDLMAFQVGWRN